MSRIIGMVLLLIISRISFADTIAATSTPTTYYYVSGVSGYPNTAEYSRTTPEAACQTFVAYQNSRSTYQTYVYSSSTTPTSSSSGRCIYSFYNNSSPSELHYGSMESDIYGIINVYTCPSGYYQSDSAGTASSTAAYCTSYSTPDHNANGCYYNYTANGGFCLTSCPPNQALSDSGGACVPDKTSVAKTLQQCEAKTSDPVIIESGALLSDEPADFIAGGSFPLTLQRTYHTLNSPAVLARVPSTSALTTLKTASMVTDSDGWSYYKQPSGYTGPTSSVVRQQTVPQTIKDGKAVMVTSIAGFGYQNWRSNYDYQLDLSSASPRMLTPVSADSTVFVPGDGNVYQASDLSGAVLQQTTDSAGATVYVYRDGSPVVRTFNAAGQLVTEQSTTGGVHSLAYDVAGRLVTVTDMAGHRLQYAYDDQGRLATVTTPVGVVTYQYDTHGNLAKVSRQAGGVTVSRSYVYDDSRFPAALTGIVDENGNRYTSWSYDDRGRVISNYGSNAAEKTTLAFTDTTTTVTNPLGKRDVYTYATTGGGRRLVQVDGNAATSCLASQATYTYNSNGTLRSETSQNGSVTTFEYNARGLVTQKIEAAGTASARTTRWAWHAVWPLPVQETIGNRSMLYQYDSAGRLLQTQVSGQ